MNRSPPVSEHPSPILNLNNKRLKRSNPLLPLFSPLVLSILPSLKYIICIAAQLSLSRYIPKLAQRKAPRSLAGNRRNYRSVKYLPLKPHLNDHARFCRSKPPPNPPPLRPIPPPLPTILGPRKTHHATEIHFPQSHQLATRSTCDKNQRTLQEFRNLFVGILYSGKVVKRLLGLGRGVLEV